MGYMILAWFITAGLAAIFAPEWLKANGKARIWHKDNEYGFEVGIVPLTLILCVIIGALLP